MDSDDQEQSIARVLIEMGGVLHSEHTVDRTLQLVTELTERTVRSASAVSVTLVREDHLFTPTASEPVARTLDEVQYAIGAGPCVDALVRSQTINVVLDRRVPWPRFVSAARALEVASTLSTPMAVDGRPVMGALNIYSPDDHEFDDLEVRTASLLSQQAAAVLANAAAFAEVTSRIEHLREALDTRDVIGQAKGILMARERCDAAAAFDLLRRASQRSNRKLRDVAEDLIAKSTDRQGA